jgi:hypothetical protein
MKCMVLVAAALFVVPTFAQTPDDEKTIKNLELEWVSHVGSSKADIDFAKRVMDDKLISIDDIGRIINLSLADVEKLAKAEPDLKSSGECTELKIQFYGPDTAIATYKAHFVQTGHKNKKDDVDADIACLDVWKKLNGQWKAIGGTNTSTKPIPPERYKAESPQGTPTS